MASSVQLLDILGISGSAHAPTISLQGGRVALILLRWKARIANRVF